MPQKPMFSLNQYQTLVMYTGVNIQHIVTVMTLGYVVYEISVHFPGIAAQLVNKNDFFC